jgi:hypothetical protein
MVTRGSEWRRWEPHIHAPGTVLNNQFGGADPWDAYLQALETRTPAIEAIGVTDYFVTDIRARQRTGTMRVGVAGGNGPLGWVAEDA